MMINKILTILILFLFFVNNISVAQNEKVIQDLVNKLSWKSVKIDPHSLYFDFNKQTPEVKKLIKTGKAASNNLIAALKHPHQTVISHIILTEIWGNENDKKRYSIQYIYKNCDDLIGWHNIFNNLAWEWKGKYSIENSEIIRIERYWKNFISDKKTNKRKNIFNDLTESDNKKYPCNKTYENNSVYLKANNLTDLLNTKFGNYELESLFKDLGNDSTHSFYSDSFYITYGADGLSFLFDSDSVLTTIFVEKEYLGELPSQIQLSQKRDKITEILGNPEKKSKYVDNTSVYYTKKGIFIDYNKEGEIIKFYLSNK